MIKMIKAVEKVDWDISNRPSVFLAGSIEMGTAEHWQERVKTHLEQRCKEWNVEEDFDLTLINPRRDDWDSSWVQDISNSQFREQVEWELEGMENSDYTFMYFSPETKSPITLLELGLHCPYANDHTLVVCPEGFWRKGNVDVVCNWFGVVQAETFEEGLDRLLERILVDWGYDFTK